MFVWTAKNSFGRVTVDWMQGRLDAVDWMHRTIGCITGRLDALHGPKQRDRAGRLDAFAACVVGNNESIVRVRPTI
jgi:hypothetical protein